MHQQPVAGAAARHKVRAHQQEAQGAKQIGCSDAASFVAEHLRAQNESCEYPGGLHPEPDESREAAFSRRRVSINIAPNSLPPFLHAAAPVVSLRTRMRQGRNIATATATIEAATGPLAPRLGLNHQVRPTDRHAITVVPLA